MHIEVKDVLTKSAVEDARKQFKSAGIIGHEPVLSISSGEPYWFNRNGPLKLLVTTIGPNHDFAKKLLTTDYYKDFHGICVLGWGMFIRTSTGFAAVCDKGISLLCLDKAISEKLSTMGTSSIAYYWK